MYRPRSQPRPMGPYHEDRRRVCLRRRTQRGVRGRSAGHPQCRLGCVRVQHHEPHCLRGMTWRCSSFESFVLFFTYEIFIQQVRYVSNLMYLIGQEVYGTDFFKYYNLDISLVYFIKEINRKIYYFCFRLAIKWRRISTTTWQQTSVLFQVRHELQIV